MSKKAKNLMIILGILTFAFAGYYFFVQDSSIVIRPAESERELEQMLVRTQEFVNHRQILDSIDLNLTVLQSNEFRSLRSFSPSPNQYPFGRSNPFSAAEPERSLINTGTSATATTNNSLPSNQE
jgi:hypothetical protein